MLNRRPTKNKRVKRLSEQKQDDLQNPLLLPRFEKRLRYQLCIYTFICAYVYVRYIYIYIYTYNIHTYMHIYLPYFHICTYIYIYVYIHTYKYMDT